MKPTSWIPLENLASGISLNGVVTWKFRFLILRMLVLLYQAFRIRRPLSRAFRYNDGYRVQRLLNFFNFN